MSLVYEKRNLKVGDYAVGEFDENGTLDGILIERKAAGDYVSSLLSGHLNNQLSELSYNSPLSYLVVIGDVKTEARERQVPWNNVLSSLVGSSFRRAPDGLQGKVDLIVVDDDWDFASVLHFLDEKWTRGAQRIPELIKRSWGPDDELLQMFMSYPKIGKVTATKLLDKFKTNRAFVNATLEELLTVDGIGKRKAEDLLRRQTMEWSGRIPIRGDSGQSKAYNSTTPPEV